MCRPTSRTFATRDRVWKGEQMRVGAASYVPASTCLPFSTIALDNFGWAEIVLLEGSEPVEGGGTEDVTINRGKALGLGVSVFVALRWATFKWSIVSNVLEVHSNDRRERQQRKLGR